MHAQKAVHMVFGCMQAFLRLSKAQRDRIAALYEEYLQEVAAGRQICISIASKVQVWDPGPAIL